MLTNKRIGIWGFGIVGKAALPYFLRHTPHIQIIDTHDLSVHASKYADMPSIEWLHQEKDLPHFLEHNDYILTSPGIDVRPYAAYRHKWLTELDLLQKEFKKPIIAVTGSVAKTTVTTLLSEILSHDPDYIVYTGGNIGRGMLSLVTEQTSYDAALLEVSSFQLEHCTTFAPALGIWTTFYPNHLDRHGSLDAYFDAKYNLLAHQSASHHALIPATLLDYVMQRSYQGTLQVFCSDISQIPANMRTKIARIFFVHNGIISVMEQDLITPLMPLANISNITFEENWLIICSALYIIGLMHDKKNLLATLPTLLNTIKVPEHRLELVATLNNISIYNDSKSTTPASTLAAVNQLKDRPITLLIGGLSKGIDRKPFIKDLYGKVARVVCFGKEAQQLAQWCTQERIPAHQCATLDEAFDASLKDCSAPGYIVLSPAGSSFDLFKDYQDRGAYFKKLVQQKVGDIIK